MSSPGRPAGSRSTQADRRARSREALLESAARELSRFGYGNLVLERVARDAGYSRGALYHQFADKQELTLAVIDWIRETWTTEVGDVVERTIDPVAALLTLARGHAVFCRRDIARMAIALRLEFAGQDHPVGHEVEASYRWLVDRCSGLIAVAKRDGAISDERPPAILALAFVGVLEGAVVGLAGHVPDDEVLAARAVAGVLGLDPATVAQQTQPIA